MTSPSVVAVIVGVLCMRPVAGGPPPGLRAGCTAAAPRLCARLTRPSPCHRSPTSPRLSRCSNWRMGVSSCSSSCTSLGGVRRRPPRGSHTCGPYARKELRQSGTRRRLLAELDAAATGGCVVRRAPRTSRPHVLRSRESRKFISQNCRGVKTDGADRLNECTARLRRLPAGDVAHW